MRFNKQMLSNPDFYLFSIFVFAILIALSSYLHGRFTNIEANKKHSDLDKSVLGVTKKIARVNSQLDTLSSYLDIDLKIRIDKLTSSVNEFQGNLAILDENIIKTQSILSNPHHPFDLELFFTVDIEDRIQLDLIEKAIFNDNINNKLEQCFRNNFPGENLPFLDDHFGNLLSLGPTRYFSKSDLNGIENDLQFFSISNHLFEKVLTGLSLKFSHQSDCSIVDEFYPLDLNTLIKYNKINTETTYRLVGGPSFSTAKYIRIKLVVKDLNFGLTNGRISNLNELLQGGIKIGFGPFQNPNLKYATFSFGKSAKREIHINIENSSTAIQRLPSEMYGINAFEYIIDLPRYLTEAKK